MDGSDRATQALAAIMDLCRAARSDNGGPTIGQLELQLRGLITGPDSRLTLRWSRVEGWTAALHLAQVQATYGAHGATIPEALARVVARVFAAPRD